MYTTLRVPAIGGVVALASMVLAASDDLAGIGFLVVGSVSVAMLLVLDMRSAPHPADIPISRIHDEIVSMNDSKDVTLTVRNPGTRALQLSLRDVAPPSMNQSEQYHDLVVAPGEAAQVATSIRPKRRGRQRLGPLTVRSAGRLGLAGRQQTVELFTPLRVYPALPGREDVELRIERARMLQSGSRSTAIRGGGTEFDSLKEYHPDDEFRRINWKATARSNKPISNLFREERNQQVLILLDASRVMAASIGEISRFEHGIDAAIAVAELAGHVGDHVGMIAFAGGVKASIGPRSGRVQSRRMLEVLFDLHPTFEAADYRGAFASLLARYRRRALLILLTEIADEEAMQPLLDSLPALLSRHLVIVGAVRDPELDALERLVPEDSEQVFLKAAAARAASGRAATAAKLGRLGVIVVDAAPGKLAGLLADQYLHIKAFGKL